MEEYVSILNEQGSTFPRRVNIDGYLRSYFHKPAFYLLSVARATQLMEAHCHQEEPPKVRLMHTQVKLPTIGTDSWQRNISTSFAINNYLRCISISNLAIFIILPR